MKVASDAIKLMSKKVDLILNVVDARGPLISSNSELLTLLPNKPIVKLALKSDLSDLNFLDYENKIIFANKYQNNLRALILNELKKQMQEKTFKLKAKGLLLPNYNVAIIGLPNVGKSTIINILLKKNRVKTENRPGVTKSISLIKLNEMFNLIDTPGVLFKKINNFEIGAKLTLMGIIKNNVVPLNEILFWSFEYLKKHYYDLLQNYLISFTNKMKFEEFLMELAKKRNFVLNKQKLNLEKSLETFFNDLINGNLGKVSYEKD